MAIFSMSISAGGGCSAGAKQKYIEREGMYAKKLEDLIDHGSIGLPSWAESSRDFWEEDDRQETGNRYREIKLALPKEIQSKDEQRKIVEDFCNTVLKDHPVTWAIHENEGRLSGEKNPHVHILVCERKIDDSRPEPLRNEYFKRSSVKKDGSRTGGYAKDRDMTGKNRREWLQNARQKAEDIINRSLERNGYSERVSCKSLADQGIERPAQSHVGAKATSLFQYGIITERIRDYRAARTMKIAYDKLNKIRGNLEKYGRPLEPIELKNLKEKCFHEAIRQEEREITRQRTQNQEKGWSR